VSIRPMIGTWEVPAIERIEVLERRRLARLGIPGLTGDLHEDLGRTSLTVLVEGSLHAEEARSGFLTELRALHHAGEPVTFVADITEASELDEVLVVGFQVLEQADHADRFRYRLVLREYVEPPEPPGLLDDLGLDVPDLADLAAGLLDGLELPDLLGGVPDVADPTAALRPALDEVRAATERVPELLGPLQSALGVSP
jgi:hypothetical protein